MNLPWWIESGRRGGDGAARLRNFAIWMPGRPVVRRTREVGTGQVVDGNVLLGARPSSVNLLVRGGVG